MTTVEDNFKDELAKKRFDTEHALVLEPRDCLVMPAQFIYDTEWLKQHDDIIPNCHIYLIGYLPEIQMVGPHQIINDRLIVSYLVGGEKRELSWPILIDSEIVRSDDRRWWLRNSEGKDYIPKGMDKLHYRFNLEQDACSFYILYIGQAFGKSGSRNALERLRSHEKLQQIALTGCVPKHFTLTVLLLELEVDTGMALMFNPRAEQTDPSNERVMNGFSNLESTTEAEKTTLYEASLIRYFKPKLNTEFKDSFPSTNMKVLAGCYEKDMSAIIAKLHIDSVFKISSDTVPQKQMHWIQHDLHTTEDRKVFFSL